MQNKVVIIGGGVAGISAAITLADESNISSILVSQMPSERAQSVMAEGGMNAALDTMGENDTTELHLKETIQAGRFLADEDAVREITTKAPRILKKFQEWGMKFDLNEDESIRLRSFGGQTKKRTAYVDTSTGKQLVGTLIAALRKYEIAGTVQRRDNHWFLKLSHEDGKVNGVYVYNRDTDTIEFIPTCCVIIASGGMNGLFGNTTGSVFNTGGVTAELFSQGVYLGNGEMIQYHPTTVKMRNKNMLMSEAIRGEGGRLFIEKDGKPYFFMEDKYPELGNLMPRDVISKEEYALQKQGYQIYLEMRHLDESILQTKLAGAVADCKEFLHLDVRKKPIPIEPGIHFFMGGILVDKDHRTSLKGLYAAGECCCQYHGANRLGGNSLLGALYGGHVAGKSAIIDYADFGQSTAKSNIEQFNISKTPGLNLRTETKHLQKILCRALGIERDATTLQEAIDEISGMIKKTENLYDTEAFLDENVLWISKCRLGLALLYSALERKESRGAHQRAEYPTESKEYRKTTVAHYKDGEITVEFKEIGTI